VVLRQRRLKERAASLLTMRLWQNALVQSWNYLEAELLIVPMIAAEIRRVLEVFHRFLRREGLLEQDRTESAAAVPSFAPPALYLRKV
jgi:hypothetical protein